MDYKYYSVIDVQDRYKTLVLAVNEPDETGEAQEKIQCYTLLEGERLIDAAPPVMRPYAGADGFIRPNLLNGWKNSDKPESTPDDESNLKNELANLQSKYDDLVTDLLFLVDKYRR